MTDFDVKAKEWDKNKQRVERAEKVAEGIIKNVKLQSEMTALEYGCGTGLLSFNLQSRFKKIVLADISDGMLEVLSDKIYRSNVNNMEARKLDLTKESIPVEKFDVIYTLMTLHHIKDYQCLLGKFFKMLNNRGYLCIADLLKGEDPFHSSSFEGHHGFNPDELKDLLIKIGFNNISSEIVYNRHKVVDGKEKSFPIFLMIAEK